MVVFTCGECNESLKKNQVEKHYQTRCRNCNMLSCVDCGKDFWGEAYKEHIKCISEEEKYSGKNYKPKPNANKGEVKQEQWLQKVQTAIDNCKANFKLKGVLERMKDYPNIPRKKAKFENFVSNSMNVRDKKLVADVWQVLLENTETETKVPESKEVQQENEDQNKMENVNGSVDQKEELKKLSKQERKAERKRVKNSVSDNDNLDKNDCNGVDSSEKPPKSKKAKKRKRQDSGAENDETDAKKQHTEETESDSNLNSSSTMNENDEDSGGQVKFDWEDTISSILKSKGEISLKKLKKKVLCEYQAQGCKAKTEERLFAKLNKKITKNPRFIVKKEKVKLKNSK